MKKQIASILFALVLFTGIPAVGSGQNGPAVSGFTDSIHSEILNETRTVWIAHPEGLPPDSLSGQKYPVIYLLDASTHFEYLSSMVRFLSSWMGSFMLPEMIVVGVLNTDRVRDMTPSHFVPPFSDSAQMASSGGADAFIGFLEKELAPYIESQYNASSLRTLIGHSLGGLTAIHAAVHHPGSFQHFLVIDPSLWWENGKLNDEIGTGALDSKTDLSIYLGIANTIGDDRPLEEITRDSSTEMEHPRQIVRFKDLMSEVPEETVRFSWKYYPEDTHGSVPLISGHDGLRFLFSWYSTRPIEEVVLDTSIAEEDMIDAIISHYEMVTEKMGFTVLPPESMINSFGFMSLQIGWTERSLALFQLNVRNYPNSANAFDSLGDHYASQGQVEQAITAYKKALAIAENPVSRQKLEQLTNNDR